MVLKSKMAGAVGWAAGAAVEKSEMAVHEPARRRHVATTPLVRVALPVNLSANRLSSSSELNSSKG